VFGTIVVGTDGSDTAREAVRQAVELAARLDADWFIHHDADEFREGPWPGVSLADAIARVDREGYNAIDFALLDFRPTAEQPDASGDPREALVFYETGAAFNRPQVKCWKKAPGPVDLVTSGGHDVAFDGRRVYPLRFLLRHYSVRSAEHGARKRMVERPYRDDERRRGWHRQYDDQAPIIRDSSTLTRFDAAAARAAIATEDALALDAAYDRFRAELSAARDVVATTRAALQASLASLAAVRERERELSERCEAMARQLELHAVEQRHLHHEIAAIYQSRTWRWTALLRAVAARMLGR